MARGPVWTLALPYRTTNTRWGLPPGAFQAYGLRTAMRPLNFAEYLALREGLLPPDRPGVPRTARVNGLPATQAMLSA